MMCEPIDVVLRPTGREIELTPEDLEEIEQLKIRARKDIEKRIKLAEMGLPY